MTFELTTGWTRVSIAAGMLLASTPSLPADEPFAGPPIEYYTAALDDPVARLQRRIESGETTLRYDEQHGYLPGLLEELEIPVSSQTLVFSKTSLQLRRISPETPRALYFNDDVYVGFVPDGHVIEISAADPRQGGIFYSLARRRSDSPIPSRRTHNCTQCHAGGLTDGVPGHIMRSVFPDADGQPIFSAGTKRTDHRSPLAERWGGWYVTGTHGNQRHLGNVLFTEEDAGPEAAGTEGLNVTDLSGRFDPSRYLSPHSDIVALLVLAHQIHVHNRITSASFEGRRALYDQQIVNEALDRDPNYRSETTLRRLDRAAEKLVAALLFVDEAPLTDRIRGTSGFEREFSARGPRDPQGRSLYQLDLERRLFRYPCSYLIDSESFDSLPEAIAERVYRQLWDVLSGKDESEDFDHLSPEDRQAIAEIVATTKDNLPDYWRP